MTAPQIMEEFRHIVGPEPTCKYLEKRAIGRGSFATVWQMVEKATGRMVVGKFMDTSKMTEKNRKFALAEASNAAKCCHPNIIQFIESVEGGGKLLLVFEFADAGDLYAQVTARAPSRYFREGEVLLIMSQLCLALNHLHEKKMMHRDLKTPNVFLTTCGLIKLGDFGFSRQYDQTLSADVGTTFCGTPYYLAPELWNQAPYSKKADMWSVGVILYELMALKKPFSGSSMRELIDKVLAADLDPLPAHYSPELKQLCADLLNVDPKKRPSVREVFQRDIMRVNGLMSLQKNVPRLATVPESIRQAMVADIEHVLNASSSAAAEEEEIVEQAKEPKEAKESKEPKEAKESKEPKEAKESKEPKEAKESKEPKEVKETKMESKEAKEIKGEPKNAKETEGKEEKKEEKRTKDAEVKDSKKPDEPPKQT